MIQSVGAGYEDHVFRKMIESGQISMVRTRAWLRHTINRLRADPSPCVNIGWASGGSLAQNDSAAIASSFPLIVCAAMVDLVAEFPNWGGQEGLAGTEEDAPETVMFDLRRLRSLNRRFHTGVLNAVILIQAQTEALNRAPRGAHQAILDAVTATLDASPARPGLAGPVVDRVLADLAPHMAPHDLDATRALVLKHIDPGHVVYRHVAKQFRLFWFNRLRGNSTYALRVPPFAVRVQDRALPGIDALANVTRVGLAVHGASRYRGILRNLLGLAP